MTEFDQIMTVLYHKAGRRNLGCFRTDEPAPAVIAFGIGKEWSDKMSALYQAWFARELANSQVPEEFEHSQPRRDELISSLIDSMSTAEAIEFLHKLGDKLCQSMSVRKGQLQVISPSLERLQGVMKKFNVVHLSEVVDGSLTKCYSELGSTDPTATSPTSSNTVHPPTTSVSSTPTEPDDNNQAHS